MWKFYVLMNFFVKDIGDAMILGAFLDELCTCGVSLLITSNVEPRDLYLNGLQRTNFLPAIETIYEYCDVLRLDSCTDYRFRELEKARFILFTIIKLQKVVWKKYSTDC